MKSTILPITFCLICLLNWNCSSNPVVEEVMEDPAVEALIEVEAVNLPGRWYGEEFMIDDELVASTIYWYFYEESGNFSLKINLADAEVFDEPQKWGGTWTLDENNVLYLTYEGEDSFLSRMNETAFTEEQWQVTESHDGSLLLESLVDPYTSEVRLGNL